MQYRNGILTSTAAAVTLNLGFVPDRFTITNYTKTAAQSGVGFSEWIHGVVANDKALISTYSVGVPTVSLLGSAGITGVSTGGVWVPTNTYNITGITNASPGVVTLTSLTPTGAMTLANGMTVTVSGVVGMNINTQRFIVAGVSGSTFKLYDLFGNPFDTTALGTYSSGGKLDLISYPPTAPVLNATTGQVITPGSPAGLQTDTGYAGVSLGTGVVGSNGDILYYEAFFSTPTGW